MFHLNYRDNLPIYAQIKEQLRKMIVTHAIQPDEKLPSIREVAQSLAINPNTIQRAYRELESEGYLYTIAGKGSYAAPRSDIDTKREQELLKQFDAVITELFYLGYDENTLQKRMQETMQQPADAKKGEQP